jgi:outer membrane protein TolC
MEVSDFDYQLTSSTVRLSLRNAFVQLLRSQEALVLKKEIARIRKKNFELVQMRYRAGVEHRGSLLTAEANLAQADFEVAQTVRSISLARFNLIKEMGLKEFKPFMVRGELQVAGVEKNKPDLDALAGVNPALQRAIRQRQAAEYDLASAKTDYAPKVYGQLGADRTGTSWPPGGTEWNAGVQMSLNLFQGGKSYYQTSKAEAYHRQLIADERSARDAVLLTLEQKWNNLQNNIDTVRVQSKFLKAAEERARIADAQYGLGSIVFDNWIIIQDTLVNAKKSFLEAEISALTSEAEWIQAKGGMLNYDD